MNTNNNDIAEESKFKEIEEEFHKGIDIVKGINPSVTFYGSARITEDNLYYTKVQKLTFRIAKELGYSVLSGGGPGIMEAANKGAFEAGGRSIGLTIKLPHEQTNNPYVTEEIPFHYFFSRQSAMSYATEVCIFCPGGFGTLSELFEVLTLEQTEKMGKAPIILFGSEYWNPIDSIIKEVLLKKYKTVSEKDVELYVIKDNEDEILEIIKNSKIRNGEDSFK
jgi:hypothetical protein